MGWRVLRRWDGDALNGDALNGQALNGDALNGQALDGKALDGRALDGRALDGQACGGLACAQAMRWPAVRQWGVLLACGCWGLAERERRMAMRTQGGCAQKAHWRAG